MREGWVETTLDQVASLQIGRTPTRATSEYWTEDLNNPFCTIADMDGKWISPSREGVTDAAIADGKARRVQAGSLLMSFKLTLGRVGFAATDLFPNEAIVAISPRSDLTTSEYLYLWLGSQNLSGGSGRAVKGETLNSKSLALIPVSLPSLAEQRRIVDVIESVDNYIAALEKRAETARTARTALLHDLTWKIDDLRPLSEVTSKIGSGATPRGGDASYKAAGTPLIRSQNVHDYLFVPEGLAFIDQDQARQLDNVKVESGDVLINITGASVNRVCRAPEEFLPARVNQHVAILRPDPSILLTDFLIYALRRSDIFAELDALSGSGTTRQALTKSQLESLRVPIADLGDQRVICDAITASSDVARATEVVAEAARNLRAALLSDLLSGNYEIPTSYDELLGAA